MKKKTKAFGILEQNMDTNEVLQDFKGDSEIPLEKIDENLDEDIMGKTIKIDVDDVKTFSPTIFSKTLLLYLTLAKITIA